MSDRAQAPLWKAYEWGDPNVAYTDSSPGHVLSIALHGQRAQAWRPLSS